MIKHISGIESVEDLEVLINSVEECSTIYLDSDLTFDLTQERRVIVGARAIVPVISIHKRDIIFDGQGHRITFRCLHEKINDIALFHICQEALGTEIRNLCLDFNYEGDNSNRKVIAVRNNAYGAKIMHCKLTMVSETQVGFTVIQNDRNVETVFDREGDNFVIEGNDIRIRCNPTVHKYPINCYGVYNDLPNSMTVSNNYIYIMLNGVGEDQKAFGIYNNGRFVRIVNNNIKANGYHMEGSKEIHTYTFGVHNEGEYLLFSANNCISEWAGKAVGLLNKSAFCTFTGNKILATHSKYAITIQNKGWFCNFSGNIVSTTSRNSRLIYNEACNVNYTTNVLRSLFPIEKCRSGCGMLFEKSLGCIASGNQISSVRNCGIFLRESEIINHDNVVDTKENGWTFRAYADENDMDIVSVLDEKYIYSEVLDEEK